MGQYYSDSAFVIMAEFTQFTQLICLANSRKRGDRCIAGIEVATGQWVRPVSRLEDGRIPLTRSTINGVPIRLLDVIRIPLDRQGQGYEAENRYIKAGEWRQVGRATIEEILPFCDREILHGDREDWLNAIPYAYLCSLPQDQRRTLQMIQVEGFQTRLNPEGKWRGTIPLSNGQKILANVTDPELCTKLDQGYDLGPNCLIVLSFSQPWKKPNSQDESLCYRLIVGVLELYDYC
jgi:hypothetical protein